MEIEYLMERNWNKSQRREGNKKEKSQHRSTHQYRSHCIRNWLMILLSLSPIYPQYNHQSKWSHLLNMTSIMYDFLGLWHALSHSVWFVKASCCRQSQKASFWYPISIKADNTGFLGAMLIVASMTHCTSKPLVK